MKVAMPTTRRSSRAGLLLGVAATVLAAMAIVAQPAQAADRTVQIWDDGWADGTRCLYSDSGAYNALGMDFDDISNPLNACNDGKAVWIFEEVDTTAGGTTLYNIRHAEDEKCVGVKGVESGDTRMFQPLQLEGCENGDDGRWYMRERSGHTYIHNYTPNHRDLVICGDPSLTDSNVYLCGYPDVSFSTWDLKDL